MEHQQQQHDPFDQLPDADPFDQLDGDGENPDQVRRFLEALPGADPEDPPPAAPAPVAMARRLPHRRGDLLVIEECPRCGRRHQHGGGDYGGDGDGHKAPHCVEPGGEYLVLEIGVPPLFRGSHLTPYLELPEPSRINLGGPNIGPAAGPGLFSEVSNA